MRKGAKRKKPVDRVLEPVVNVLSVVYSHFYFPYLLERPQRRRRLPGLLVDRTRSIGDPEPGVAGQVGGDARRNVAAEVDRRTIWRTVPH